MEIIYWAIHLLIFGILIWRFRSRCASLVSARVHDLSLLLKTITTIGLGLIYLKFYDGGDTWNYHRQAAMVVNHVGSDISLWLDFLFRSGLPIEMQLELDLASQPRAMLFMKLIAVMHLLTGSSYWLTSFYLSLLAYYSAWFLLASLIKVNANLKFGSIIALLFVPTVVFWSSGIIKESVTQSMIYVVVAVWLQWSVAMKFNLIRSLVALACIVLLFFLKYYYAVTLGVILLAAGFTKLVVNPNLSIRTTVVFFLTLCLFFFGGTSLHPNLHLDSFWSVIVENYYLFESKSSPHNIIHYHNLNASFGSFFLNMPLALFSGLFRPIIFEGGNALKALAGIENVILVIFGIGSVNQLIRKRWKIGDPMLIWSGVVFILVMATFLAFAAPNLGTLSRYRIGFLPVLWILIFARNPIMSRIEKRVFLWLNII